MFIIETNCIYATGETQSSCSNTTLFYLIISNCLKKQRKLCSYSKTNHAWINKNHVCAGADDDLRVRLDLFLDPFYSPSYLNQVRSRTAREHSLSGWSVLGASDEEKRSFVVEKKALLLFYIVIEMTWISAQHPCLSINLIQVKTCCN